MADPRARHGEMLSAVAYAVKRFALSSSWESAAADVLAELGRATASSRVYVFQNKTDDSGRLCMDEVFEWLAPGISGTIQMDDNHDWPYEDGYEYYSESLGSGGVIQRLASEVEHYERADFEDEGIRSTVFVPIFVADEWWGYMGFDDCVEERHWEEIEIQILRTAAETMGAVIQRQRLQDMLMEAQERFRVLVEKVPAVLYIDEPGDEMTTSYISPQVYPLLGITQNEWMRVADIWDSNIHPEDRDRTVAEYRAVMGSAEPFTQEYRMIRPTDGRVVWIRDDTTFLTNDEGEIVRIQGVMYDITVEKEAEAEVARTRAQYQNLVERIPVAVYTESTDSDLANFYMSPQIQRITGHSPSAFEDPTFWEAHVHEDDRERVLEADRVSLESGEPFSVEYRFITASGGEVWLREEAVNVAGPAGEELSFGVIADITAQKTAEEQLSLAQERYRALVEEIPAIVYLDPIDPDEASIYVSPQVGSILGVTAEEWLSNPTIWRELLHPDDMEKAWETYEHQIEEGDRVRNEYRMVRKDNGAIVWIREEAATLRDERGEPYMTQGLMYDITASKEAEAQIAFLAYHDALTRLANRALFEEMLEPALARARRNDLGVAVLFMDLDRFKEVNDTWGHDAGDELLRQVAERLLDSTRETDLVARQGGDEFLVLLSDLDLTAAPGGALDISQALAERIRRAMKVPFRLAAAEVQTSASIGVSIFPFDAADGRTLLKNADSAMYESKKAQRGSVVMHPMTGTASVERDSLMRSLRSAVKEKPWTLHYQPSVELASGKITSVEALLRWKRTEGGFVPPGEFLPLAEEMGLIEIIGEWVFEEICRQHGEWMEHGVVLPVGFNLSLRQLWQKDLVPRLVVGLQTSGLNAKDIIIEVSESTAMMDPARAQIILTGLSEEGFRIAIDDFGAGYTPPEHIRGLPIDVLKIDQPLIREIPDDREVAAFIESVVAFGIDLGCRVHAEGVETEEQRAFLVEKGCGSGQGYLFSRPLPAAEMTELFERGDGFITFG